MNGEQAGNFARRRTIPPPAMVTLTTHDLATLSGFWQGEDIDLAHRLGQYDDEKTWQRPLAERHQ